MASAVLRPRWRTHMFGGVVESELAAARGQFGGLRRNLYVDVGIIDDFIDFRCMITKVETIKKIIQFIKDVASDERIPDRDKAIILACVALVISPIDFIPDWIPVIGLIDDLVIIAIVLDYFFDRLDQDILLSHYPFGMRSFVSIRRFAKMISWMTPNWAKSKLWKYQKTPYR